ncbi:MAG: discoidin domain-containing protein [Thermoanaerobaculales bacterium]
MGKVRTDLAVLAVFGLLTIVMTFPVITEMGTAVKDPGDPLLNAWILSWDVEQLKNGNISGFFDANIFFPYERTLAYSEHLFPQSLVAAAPLLLTGNPVFAYNVVLLVAFLTSAFGMYVYARYLTGQVMAGVVAGIVYAFSPFMFAHLSHLQIVSAGGIPLVFLFLARFFAHERWRDLAFVGLFSVVQILANGYYAVYLSFFVTLTVAYHTLAGSKLRNPLYLVKLAVLALTIAALVGPFLYQYVAMQHEMEFRRTVDSSVELTSFLATPKFNRPYGWMSLGHNEARLFPGLAAVLLATLGGLAAVRFTRGSPRRPAGPLDGRAVATPKTKKRVFIAICSVATVAIVLYEIGTVTPNYFHALLPFVLLLAARCTVDERFRRRWFPPLATPRSFLFLHLFFLGLAFILSFGLSINGPYGFLYKYVPGFDGLRVASRIHIITMMSIAVLAAFGMKALIASRRRWIRGSAAVVIPLVALVEYTSIPVPSVRVPVKDELPAVYRWLADEGGDGPILELPLPLRQQRHRNRPEIFRTYCSTLHWRPMVNGYSGISPPIYRELRRRWEDLPPQQTIHDAQLLGVRYVILHTDEFDDKERLAQARAGLAETVPASRRVRREGPAEVWELAPGEGATDGLSQLSERSLLPREGWVAQASVNGPRAMRAIDNRIETWWNGGPLEPRTWFLLDLRSVHTLRGIEFKLGENRRSFPHGFVLEVSTDGESWRVVSSKELTALPITAFFRPNDLGLKITFEPTKARYLRITNTVNNVSNRWFIREIDVW